MEDITADLRQEEPQSASSQGGEMHAVSRLV